MSRSLTTNFCTTIYIFIACVLFCTPVIGADLVNGGFESGDLTGWNSIGSVTVEDANAGFDIPEGTHFVILQNHEPLNTSSSISDIESFLEIPSGSIQALSSEPVIQGSAIKQTISVLAGEKIVFSFNFATNNDVAPDDLFNDFAFFSIANANHIVDIADTFSTLNTSPSPLFALSTGTQQADFVFPTSGIYTVGFGIIDVGDQFFNSALLVDAVAVPEITSINLIGAGIFFFVLIFILRRVDIQGSKQ